MTFEEIQKTIEGMLADQRELQEGQLKIQENQNQIQETQQQMQAKQAEDAERFNQQITELREFQTELSRREAVLIDEVTRLIEVSNRHENRINQLIGYSITDESDRYHLMERVQDLDRRLRQLENQRNET